MIRGIYTAATGMVAEMNRLNIVANNLANVNATGFKSDQTTLSSFESLLLNAYDKSGVTPVGTLGLGVQINPAYTDFSNGALTVTGSKTDLAIEGDALFSIEAPGGTRYTRAGNFTRDQDNFLVTQEGYKLLGEKGPIQVAGDFQITTSGEVTQGGQVIDRLQLVATGGMQKEGETLYTAEDAQPAGNYQVIQGSLEQSNVNAIRQMIEMINLSRSYETNQKALTAHDETLGKVVNELTR
ncbi:MAG TPA: flagellar basal-body rod protein FlgF [Bacillota bacterium]|nr:flagellar basal-body rod protein FlgF [Bacillota bacterium]